MPPSTEHSFWIRRAVLLGLALLGVLVSSAASAQELVARVDRTRLSENETLLLEVVYSDRADTGSIDFEAALPDFSILSLRPSSQTQYTNGRRSSRTSWGVTLSPRRTGRLRIPPFKVKGKQTQPITIEVKAAAASPEEGAPFSAVLTLDREQVFVGEQVLATISLSAARDIGNLSGSALEIPGIDVTLVHQREFRRTVQGTAYQVTELVYAFFPVQAGPLELGAYEYRGVRNRRQQVIARTSPLQLDVLDPARDPDASSRQPWFPASGVAVASEWNGDPENVRVGEPITRTVKIAAAGQRAAAILPLQWPDGNFKKYAEQPELSDAETSTGILGTRTESVVLVPTQSGELHLPAIDIDWWNIEARRWEKAHIPAARLTVRDAPTGASAAADSPAGPLPGSGPDLALSAESPGEGRSEPGRWPWIVAAFAALSFILGVACFVLWQRVRFLEQNPPANTHSHSANGAATSMGATSPSQQRQTLAAVLAATGQQDAEATRRALIIWGKSRWPSHGITSLDQIAALAATQTDSQAGPQLLRKLDAILYGHGYGHGGPEENGANTAAYDYGALARWIESLPPAAASRAAIPTSALPKLYPEHKNE